ncbi:MAG TPA: hemophilus-specific protein [Marinobacter sp.]|nr:hemophilus-specific protein [Marinobacter sp.]
MATLQTSTPQAIPVRPDAGRGMLRVVSSTQLQNQESVEADTLRQQQEEEEAVEDQLASHIRARMVDMRNFRNAEGISERLLNALRTYKGMYDAGKLNEIKQFGGSEVFARVTPTKCRAATALLRDVYLSQERPWDVEPTPVPVTPASIETDIQQLVNVEVNTLMQLGQQVDQQMVADRIAGLRKAAERAAKKVAHDEAEKAGDQLNDILVEGNFYQAFAEFLIDLPIFPFAVMKGPEVRRITQTKWVEKKPTQQSIPKMFWKRVSPFDLYWSPGAATIEQAEFIERIKVTRKELRSVKGLPGYNSEAIDAVLKMAMVDGLHEWWDTIDTARAELEDRERWARTATSLIDTAEYTGWVSGELLSQWGMSDDKVPDKTEEYFVTAWLIDRYVIKVQINPATNQRAPYYITAFEQIPGALIGYGLPDLLEDVQTICNAAARSLVNNAGIASGPQVIINDAVLQPGETDDLYPWKRWHVNYDPALVTSGTKPIEFFQPEMNVVELMGIYTSWSSMGDEISAIPKYMTGDQKVGGAGRTASGLAMLMGNASKTLQNIAASIDRDVIDPILHQLYDMIMLTNPNMFRGDELIVVKGVGHAVKREQDRMRQLEFLQLTANPIDMAILGPEGRANVLRSVAQNLGLEHERTVPDDEQIQLNMQQQAAAQAQGVPTAPVQGGDPSQTPAPEDERAPPEEARREIEADFTGVTGRPGMRAGG